MSPLPAPFPPLVADGEGLDRYPDAPLTLASRMAEVYGVPADSVLPVRGVTHGLELVWRGAARDGAAVQAPDAEPYRTLAALYAPPAAGAPVSAVIVRGSGSPEAVAEMAERVAPALLVVDEGLAEFADAPSAATVIADRPNLVVLRSLSLAYGLAGARVGAALGWPETLARLAAVMEPWALPAVSVRLALQALDPSRLIETTERIAAVRRERQRLAEALAREMTVEPGVGPVLVALVLLWPLLFKAWRRARPRTAAAVAGGTVAGGPAAAGSTADRPPADRPTASDATPANHGQEKS